MNKLHKAEVAIYELLMSQEELSKDEQQVFWSAAHSILMGIMKQGAALEVIKSTYDVAHLITTHNWATLDALNKGMNQ